MLESREDVSEIMRGIKERGGAVVVNEIRWSSGMFQNNS